MKLKALVSIQTADDLHLPGAVFDSADVEAKYLLDHGYAEAVEAAKADAPKAAPAKKAAKPADADDGL